MKKVFWINPLILAAILFLIACEKEITPGAKEYKFTHWPVVKTLEATTLSSTTATLNGTVNCYGLPTKVTFEYYTSTTEYGKFDTISSYISTVTARQSPLTGNGIINVSAEISGLTPCPIYHFRVKAENSLWKNFYGSDETFCPGNIPTLTTASVSGLTSTTAIMEGNITDDGGAVITERGFIWWQASNTTGKGHKNLKDDDTGAGSFTSNLTGLRPNTNYRVKAYAINCTCWAHQAFWAEGNIISFTTSP